MANFKKTSTGWQARFSWYENGKRHETKKSGFKTKNEARLYVQTIEADVKNDSYKFKDLSFTEYYGEWVNLYKRNKLSNNSLKQYDRIARLISENFKSQRLRDITRRDYQLFINNFGETHAPQTVRKLHSICKACISSAIYDGIISKDFTLKIELNYNKNKIRQVEYLSVKELNTLTNVVKANLNPNYPNTYMILTAIFTGMRIGEIMSLTWNDINFNWKTININKTWDYSIPGQEKAKEPKTESSNRIIKVNDDLLLALRDLKHNSNLVFANQLGTLANNQSVNKTLQLMLRKAKINKKGFHFHSLRHSHVAYLLYKGVDLYAISKRLGHSDMTITSRKYAYLIDEFKVKTDTEIENYLNDIGQQPKKDLLHLKQVR